MNGVKNFEELDIWKSARVLCKDIFQLCSSEELKQQFSFVNQILRSSGSVMDNIAEGFERDGNKEFRHFLYISKASLGEVKSQLYRLEDMSLVNKDITQELLTRATIILKRIASLISYLSKNIDKGLKYKQI